MVKRVLAFDIGGTSMRAAVVEGDKFVKYLHCSTPHLKKEFVSQLFKFGDELFSSDIKGIGIGCAGVIKNGVIKTSPNLPIKNFDMKGILEKRYKTRVEVFNDAGCHSLAELYFGCKKKNFVIITLGTGIGGGLIIEGKPYRGEGFGGEVGHIYVRGVDFESLWKQTRSRIIKEFGRNMLIKDLVKLNDSRAKKILEDVSDYLGEGLSSIAAVLDPEIIVIAGGPSESGEKFIFMIQKSVNKYNFLPKKTQVSWTKLKHTGVLGASLLIK